MKQIIIAVVSRKDFRHESHYKFPLPEAGEPNFYRQVTSFNCFFHNNPPRNRSKTHLFLITPGEDDIQATECDDIWDFYTKIGYDRSKKRWT